MYTATCFPEASPMRTITASSVVKALVLFYIRPSLCNPNWSRHKIPVKAFQTGPQNVKRTSHSLQCIRTVVSDIKGDVQESLGFNPSELVFGHMPRGPLKPSQDKFLVSESSAEHNPSIHRFSSAYLGPGRGGSCLSRDTQTSLSTDTSSSSSGRIPKCSQASWVE